MAKKAGKWRATALIAGLVVVGGVMWHVVSASHLKRTLPVSPQHFSAHTAIAPRPLYAGIVEGFYGPRWSRRQTEQIFSFMHKQGLNTFVYAPKNVPYLRAQWNVPYPQSHLNKLHTLVMSARAHHVLFICSISPGLSIQYSSQRDRQELLNKINALWGIGIHAIMLSFDDIPTTLKAADQTQYHDNLALAQASLVDSMVAREKSMGHHMQFFFTPTVYWGTQNTLYWQTLAKALDPGIPVIWTGPYVLSATITAQQARQVQKDVDHPLMIWDNYPVNDYTYVMWHHPQILLGPVMGRSPNLPNVVRGYLFNPMLQPYASEVAIATGAQYLRTPSAYHPLKAWHQALDMVAGPGAAEALQSFAGANSVSFLHPEPLDPLTANIKAFWTAQTAGKDLEKTALYAEFARWTRNSAVLQQKLPPALFQEIKPWVSLYAREGILGVQVIKALQEHRPSLAASLNAAQSAIEATPDQLSVYQSLNQWFAKALNHLSSHA
ncbi:MAG: hypothetical protein C7B44_05325 [Sulfobacillus thermosulfidooxidans]|nr:MAG: hypothetical protein C7B44_05325 [Sulfobacillus thermosulfidooxidans]